MYEGFAWLIITGSGLDDWIYWYFFRITTNYNSSQSMTVYDSLHSLLDCERVLFCCDWLDSSLRIGHFFSFCCQVVNTPQLNTQLLNSLTTESLKSLLNYWLSNDGSLTTESFKVKVKVTLRLAVYHQSICLGVKPLESHYRRFVFSCGISPYVTSSLTRRLVCLLWICLAFRQ
jgi:hypothetical protein